MEQRTEVEIVIRILNGDKQAYALLVDEYKTAIYNLAYRMTGNLEDAEDLAQEAFLQAYRSLARYDTQRRFYTWLYTVSLNIIRNHLKKTGRRQANQLQENTAHVLESFPDVRDAEESVRERQRRIDFCMPKLNSRLRELIILRFYQGLSFEAIADITGSSQSAVKMRIYRGLEKLRELMRKM